MLLRLLVAALYGAAVACATSTTASVVSELGGQKKQNMLFIFVDDQDAEQDSLLSMPRLQHLLVDEGTEYANFYSPISLCCPARTSFLRAQYAHNTNVTHVIAPWGGWSGFVEKGYNGHYLPTFLKEAGYYTGYTGKFMNEHTVVNDATMHPSDWDDADFSLDPYTYNYFNGHYARNAGEVISYTGEYTTDVLAKKTTSILEGALNSGKPWFVVIAPVAPHSELTHLPDDLENVVMTYPGVAERHRHMFMNATIDKKRSSFNPDVVSGVSWVRSLPKLSDENVEYIDEFYRRRLRALQAVDELVEQVIQQLDDAGVLEDTYIVYSADNGYNCGGAHRRQPGKTLPYEEDIHVPFVVRGPGVPKGKKETNAIYSLSDLGASFLHLAGAKPDYDIDGEAMPWSWSAEEQKIRAVKTYNLNEYWVQAVVEGEFAHKQGLGGMWRDNSTYYSIRVIEGGLNFYHAVWCTGERELYNMTADPHQMDNLAMSASPLTIDLARLQERMNALILVLKTCKGQRCNEPWETMFPKGGVHSMTDALSSKYDRYFSQLPIAKFAYCDIGYHLRLESPFWEPKLNYDAFSNGVLAGFVVQQQTVPGQMHELR